MKKALVAGLGIQGVAIAYGMSRLGYSVDGIDVSGDNLAHAIDVLRRLDVPVNTIEGDILDALDPDSKPDVVISALPFRLNFELAHRCVESRIRYCDLGGNIDTANQIRELALESAHFPLMTDLGLAPGIANIIAEIGFRELGAADSIKIRVGGLPAEPRGSLNYALTFSPLGLYNEYSEECLIIRDGKKQVVEPLTEVEHLQFEGVGELEAFTTSGGTSNTLDTMLERGVTECNYKTLRYPGHVDLIRFMLNECRMDFEAFSEAVVNACGFTTEDQVLMDIDVRDSDSGKAWRRKFRVLHDQNFTAMQKTTGFGAAVVAAILGSGMLDDRKYVMYADIPSGEFIRNMKALLPEMSLDVSD